MKKIWYLTEKKTNDRKTVKILLYKEGATYVMQLDMRAFGMKFPGKCLELLLYMTGGEIVLQKSIYFSESGSSGIVEMRDKSIDECASRLNELSEKMQLQVKVCNLLYTSDLQDVMPYHEECHGKEADAGTKVTKYDSKSEADVSKSVEYLDEDMPSESEESLKKSGMRKIVELGILEDEMLFAKYMHNSFLLHGYYNYGHLVVEENEEKSRLGVPGNYYEREQMVASMFGFPNFEPEKNVPLSNGVFGYYFTKW